MSLFSGFGSCFVFNLALAATFALSALAASPAMPTHAQEVPSCVVGSWRIVDLAEKFHAALDQVPGASVNAVTGDMIIAIQPGGSFTSTTDVTVSYVQAIPQLAGQSIAFNMRFLGSETGSLSEETGNRLVESIATSEVTMTISSDTPGFEGSTSIPMPSVEGVYVYDCTRGALTVLGTARDGTVLGPSMELRRVQ